MSIAKSDVKLREADGTIKFTDQIPPSELTQRCIKYIFEWK